MTPVRLRFAEAPAGLQRRLAGHAPGRAAALGLLLLAAALGCCAAVAWQTWHAEAELALAREALQALQLRKYRRPVQGAEPAKARLTAQQLQAGSEAVRQLNTPWAALLDALEATLPDGIALVSIEPDAARGSLRLQAEAKSLDDLLAYARALDSHALFVGVELAKHETNDQDRNRPLRLSVDIRMKDRPALVAVSEGGAR